MPIQPKFQIGRKERKYFATKTFTDRELPREVFFNHLHSMNERLHEDYDVIVYYGVGGIGKTSLQKQLKVELVDYDPHALYTSLDFKDHSFHTPARALLELVREIKYQKNITFAHFELAYSLYFYKRNPDITYNEKKLRYEKELSILGSIISTLDGLGIAGSITGIVGKVYESGKKWHLKKEVKEQLIELEHCSLQEMEERLIAFFAYDLRLAIEKYNIKHTVIFLDTFEAIWSSVTNKATIHSKDKWVRDLIGSLPDVLFVICGREYLEWEKYDSDWKEILDHHIIENLSTNDADSFLENCGITEKEVRQKIITSSSGHPYHLDLSVDTYFEMKNLGEEIHADKFASNQREILDRFLQYLTDEEIETLKIMTTPRFYTEDMFHYLLREHPTGYAATRYHDFNKFSFITKEQDKQFIHALMRQGMLDYTNQELSKRVHHTLATYYDKLVENYASTAIHPENEIQALEESIFHHEAYLEQEAFFYWLSTACLPILKKLQLRGETRFLRQVLEQLYQEHGASALGLSLMQILIDMVHLNGEYQQAITMIENLFANEGTAEILANKEKAHLAIRKVHHQMFSKPVDGLIEELLSYESILKEKDWTAEYNELLFMVGGNLGVLSGDMKFSREWLVKSIRYAKETEMDNYLVRALRKYADVLKVNGHLKWARKCCEVGIELARKGAYDRYEAILVCTLADIHRMERAYSIADDFLDEAMKQIKKVGIKGWEGHIFLSKGELNFQKGQYAEAHHYFNLANELYQTIDQEWGLIQANIGLERCKLEGEAGSEHPINYWIQKAANLNYQIQETQATQTSLGNTDIIVLPFL
ncbi:hypothetical protein [Ornithinibacillus californiensis]|uniref:hypothetical protein n=1 Tax=Ornithinibacillus californiensis TaxID=161536 RepID=UPI00064D9123|nr:hypothetical protein [Ornithinibacillus californiensis]